MAGPWWARGKGGKGRGPYAPPVGLIPQWSRDSGGLLGLSGKSSGRPGPAPSPRWRTGSWRPATDSSGSDGPARPPGYWGPGPADRDPYCRLGPRPPGSSDSRSGGRGLRWDVQVRRPKQKASAVDAWAAAGEIALGDGAALEELESDKYAPTTKGPKDSKREFVEGLVVRATGHLYPLMVAGLQAAAACLKRGRYKSAAGYLGELKRGHLKAGAAWSDGLALEMRDCVRSMLRGMGPPDRAPEVRASLAAAASGAWRAGSGKSRRGPARPKRAWATAVGWGLREVELAGLSLHRSSVQVWEEKGRRKARLFLPLTKMDQGGKGSPRTWSCVCDWGPLPDGGVLLGEAGLCPACCVHEQVAEQREATGCSQEDPAAASIPLYPDSGGRVPTKEGTVAAWDELFQETVEEVLAASPEELEDWPELIEAAEAYDRVTGHSARRSGAKLWARAGWRTELIKFLYRWGSDTVMAYIEEVVAIGQEVGGVEWAPDAPWQGWAPPPPPPPPLPQAVVQGEGVAADSPDSALAAWTAEMKTLQALVEQLGSELAGAVAGQAALQAKPVGVSQEAFDGAMKALRQDLRDELAVLAPAGGGTADSPAPTAEEDDGAVEAQAAGAAESEGEASALESFAVAAPSGSPPGGVTSQRVLEIVKEELAKARRGPAYCRGPGSHVFHAVASAHPLTHPVLHETWCSWKFGVVPEVTRFDEVPKGLRYRVGSVWHDVRPCDKCWRHEPVAPLAEGQDDGNR